MNVGELRNEIMNLAFEERSSMEEYADIVNEAITRAIYEICTTFVPISRWCEIEQTKPAGAEYVRYDMAELAEDYMTFLGRVSCESDGRYRACVPYLREGNSVFLLPGDMLGTFRIWYGKKPSKITADTPETDELELDSYLHILVPHLASFYVWLDDDERKATIFYNRYDELKKMIAEKVLNQPMAVIESGVTW